MSSREPQVLVILHLFKGLTEKGETYFGVECTLPRETIITLLLAAFSVRWFSSTQSET